MALGAGPQVTLRKRFLSNRQDPSQRRFYPSFLRRDGAVAEVMGTVMIVGLTVLMTAGLVTLLLATKPGPADTTHAEFTIQADKGAGDWATGDETLKVRHTGGEPLHASDTVIFVTLGDTTTRYEEGGSDPLEHGGETAFDDGRFTIGERWHSSETSIDLGAQFSVNLVALGETSEVLWASSGRAGNVACGTDLTEPRVTAWTQSPSDVDSSTTGAITVTATIKDVCNEVDATSPPTLEYRINDGSNPSWQANTTPAPMDRTAPGGDDWTADIPSHVWINRFGETLEYRITGMTDTEGNTGTSPTQSDKIHLIGTDTYISNFIDVTGKSNNDTAAQNDDDGDAEADLQERANGTADQPLTTSTYNAQAATSTGGFSPGSNAGSSDNTYDTASGSDPVAIRYPLADETGTPGTVVSVTLKAEVRGNNHVNNWYLTPCLNTGSVTCGAQSGSLGSPTTDTPLTYNVTTLKPGGGSWSASDIDNLEIEVDAAGQNTNANYWIDHVYAEVEYRPAATTQYDLNIKSDINGLSGTIHQLQLEYRAVTEDFELYVFDYGTTSWIKEADLTSTTRSTVAVTLDTSQVDASGNAQVRFLDKNAGTDGSLWLDYVKVVSA